MANPTPTTDELIEFLATFALDPLGFVLAAFPWGEPGSELESRSGPEPWQVKLLTSIGTRLRTQSLPGAVKSAIREATKSGHNIGKSACVCWIVLWAISTREDTKGVVTANTEKQLRLKLWAELAKWHRLFIASDMFLWSASAITARDPLHAAEWRIDAIPWSEDNPEAFAGLHNYGKRVLVVFDEASAIADPIWETISGVMNEADTELIWIATGNPTRNTGRFRECFDSAGQGRFWNTHTIDSREVSFVNKDAINAEIDLWGVESDYIRVRWLGEFPTAANAQLIDSETIRAAQTREAQSQHWEPLIMSVDVARFGENQSVIGFRRGKDARSAGPTIRRRGASNVELGMQIASLISIHNPDAVFIDEGGVGGGVIDFVRHLGHSVIGVQFGAKPGIPLGSDKPHNKRAEMYLSLRHWLREGGAIDASDELSRELIAIEYGYAKKSDAIQLISKDDMSESPDWADQLAMTFAYPVSARSWRGPANRVKVDYDPLAATALPSERDLYRNQPYESIH